MLLPIVISIFDTDLALTENALGDKIPCEKFELYGISM